MSPLPAPMPTIRPVVVKTPVPIILAITIAEAGTSVRTRRFFSVMRQTSTACCRVLLFLFLSFHGKRNLHGMSGGNYQKDCSILKEMKGWFRKSGTG